MTPTTFPRPSAPGWVTVLDIGRDQLERPIHYFERLGDSFESSWLGVPMVATRDPALIEEVLVRQHKRFRKDVVTRGLSALLGQGLLTSERETWRESRRVIGPHFQAGETAAYLPVFREEAERELARWPTEQPFDVHGSMTRVTLRVALRSIFGSDGAEDVDVEEWMRTAVLHFLGIAGTWVTFPLSVPTPGNRRFLRARALLRDTVERLIRAARERGAGNSVLGTLLAAHEGGELTHEQLVDEGITLLLAGHETSALTLSYACMLLAEHPHEQGAIAYELLGREPTGELDALRASSRLLAAVKETLRLYPPAWAIGREAIEPCEILGVPLRAGTQVFLYQWAAHRHPRWFDEPEAFRPGRWNDGLESRLPRGLYTPFGGGPRVCVGNHFALAEILIVLETLLRQRELSLAAPFSRRFVAAVTLRPRDPLLLSARPRR